MIYTALDISCLERSDTLANRKTIDDHEILRLSLIGLGQQLANTNAAISDIRARLHIRGPRLLVASTDGTQPTPKRRKMSAAARKRIAEATRKRWIAFRKSKDETAEKPAEKPKRKMSKAGRAAIIAATKARWRKFHRQQKAAANTAA